eukprot:318661-Amphidinium_carterae.1
MLPACRFCLKVSLSAWACFSAIDICFFPITAAVLEKGIIDSDGDVTLPDPDAERVGHKTNK